MMADRQRLDNDKKGIILKRLTGILGQDRVFSEPADLVPYSRDTFALRFSEEDKHLPDFVAVPTSTKEVSEIVKIASEYKLPVIAKGGGTSRTGMIVPIHGGIVIDTIRMNKLLKLNRADYIVRVQAGMNLQELELLLNAQGLTLGHEQGSQKIATVGGAISTASYSRKNQKYGNLWERISNLEVVLGDGSVLRTGPDVPYTSSGINLASLFVGAEGTLGIITEASIRIFPRPEVVLPLMLLFDDFPRAEEAADAIMARGIAFVGGSVWENEKGFGEIGYPESRGAMIIAFEGCKEEVSASAEAVRSIAQEHDGRVASEQISRANWDEFLMHWCGMRAEVGNEDVIVAFVPRARKQEYFKSLLEDILPRHGLTPLAGERKSFDFGRHMIFATRFSIPRTDQGWEHYISAVDEASRLVASLGGTIAACHGIGLLHRDHVGRELGETYLKMFSKIKKAFDPDNILNPGKKFPISAQ
ncbi:MAG: FAD-binding oxidoreductase [Thermoplasmata archaeon]